MLDWILGKFKSLHPKNIADMVRKRKYELLRNILLIIGAISSVLFLFTNFLFSLPSAPIFLVVGLSSLLPGLLLLDFSINHINKGLNSLFGDQFPFLAKSLDLNEEIGQLVDKTNDRIIKPIKNKDFLKDIFQNKELKKFLLEKKDLKKSEIKENIKDSIKSYLKEREGRENKNTALYPEGVGLNIESEKLKKNEKNQERLSDTISECIHKYLKKTGRDQLIDKDFKEDPNTKKSPIGRFIDETIENDKIHGRFLLGALLCLPLIGLGVAFAPVFIGASISTGASFGILGVAAILLIGLSQLGAKRIVDKTNEIPTKVTLTEVPKQEAFVGSNSNLKHKGA